MALAYLFIYLFIIYDVTFFV